MKDRLLNHYKCIACGDEFDSTYVGKHPLCRKDRKYAAEAARASTPQLRPIVNVKPPLPIVVKATLRDIKPTHTRSCLSNLGAMLKDKGAGY